MLFAGTIRDVETLFLYGDADQSHEFALLGDSSASSKDGVRTVAITPETFSGGLRIVEAPTHAGQGRLVLWADSMTAQTFWAPPLLTSSSSSSHSKTLANYFQFGTNASMLVGGPYLVRNATLSGDGHTLELRGDLNETVEVTLVVPEGVRSVLWNGERVSTQSLSLRSLSPVSASSSNDTAGEDTATTANVPAGAGLQILSATLRYTLDKAGIRILDLTRAEWKFADSLPEATQGEHFDDSAWVVANHTTSNIPGAMPGDVVLFGM